MSVKRTSSQRGTATMARPVDSLNRAVNGVDAVALADGIEPDPRPDAVAQRTPRRGHGEAAVGEVVRRVDEAVAARR